MQKIAIAIAVLLFVISTALAQNRTAVLASPTPGHADPGDTVMEINISEPLPNVVGAPDIFGRRRPAGRVVLQYLGTRNGTAYFLRQTISISSNETTMSRTPLFVPHTSQTYIGGQAAGRPFTGYGTTYGTTIVPPRPHSETSTSLTPTNVTTKVPGSVHIQGHVLRVVRANSDGSIDFMAR